MNRLTASKLGLVLIVSIGLVACGGGGGGGSTTPPTTSSRDISGGGVKGPLANAIVNVYNFDSSQAGFKGTVAATGTTDAAAAITGLALTFPVAPPYIMEFTSDAGTTDITTGTFPVIDTMRTVMTQALLDTGEQIYATPLTTIAVDIAVANAADTNGTAGIQADEFEAALSLAATQVVSTLGFGMDSSIDIFDTPPLVDSTTDSTAEQADVAAYRSAVEAVTAIAYQIDQQTAGGDTDSVLAELAADLADGGGIDGSAGSEINTNTLQVLEQDPATLPIPNSPTNQTVADVQDILVAETTTTGTTTSTTDLDTGGTITTTTEPAEADPDIDGDGVLNVDDAFPENPDETVDTDGDGIGDVADLDDNNNGILDVDEGLTPTPAATDADLDGVDDSTDNCAANYNPGQTDVDGDNIGDACDTDNDNDLTPDATDAFPLDASEQSDADSDGVGDIADTDDDNDGLLDTDEDLVADADTDGIPNREDTDSDDDGVFDSVDFAPYDSAVTFNFAPTTRDSSVTTDEDTAAAFTLIVSDDGAAAGALVYNIGTPSNGVISGTAPDLTYTPVADFNGSDSFTFSATDSAGEVSNTSTVSITVNSVNDAPTATAGNLTIAEDSVSNAGTVSGSDIDGDPLTYALSAQATNGTAEVNADGSYTYTPNANYSGGDSFSFVANDGTVDSAAESVTITVTGANDAPTATAGSLTVVEDSTANPGTVSGSDIDGDGLTYALSAQATNGTATVNADGSYTYTPDADFNGADSFSFVANDASLPSAPATVAITVTALNDAPVGNVDAFNAGIAAATVLDVLANDTDIDIGDTLSIVGVTQGSRGSTVSHNGATVTFTDVVGAGTETFTYDLSDGVATIPAITVTMTITANVPPVANDDTATTDEDTAVTTGDVLANDTDGGDGPGSLSITVADTTSVSSGAVTNNGDGTFTYTPASDFNGTDSFTYTVTDGASTSVGTVNVTVNAVNDAPVAFSDSDTTDEDTALTTINVLTNDTDVELDLLSISAADVSSSNGGVVVNNGNGTFDYTPAGDDSGTDTFSYTVSDGFLTASATVTITVNPVNDAPVAINDSETATVNTSLTIDALANDTDVDGDTLSVVAGNPTATNGTVVNNGDGTFDYTPDTDFTGSDSFDYTVSDSVLIDVGTVNITVNPPGDVATMSILLDTAQGGGVGGLESYTDGVSGEPQLETWRDVYDSTAGTFTFVDTVFDYTAQSFVVDVEPADELWLTSSGTWELNLEVLPVLTADNGDGSMTVSVRNLSDTEEVGRFKLSALTTDISGQLMSDHLPSEWVAQLTDGNAVFTAGALQVNSYNFEPLIDNYGLEVADWCEFDDPARFAALSGNCNGVPVDEDTDTYATTLDEVIAPAAWVDPNDFTITGLVAAPLGFDDFNNTQLLAEMVSGGDVNYYIRDYSAANGTDAVILIATELSGWVRDTTVNFTDMIRFAVPASVLSAFPEQEDINMLLAVQNSAVRVGVSELTGATSSDEGATLNGIAMDQVLANFTPPISLVGTWRPTAAQNDPNDFVSLSFFADGTYTHAEVDFDDATEISGMEWGTYSRDPATGLLTVTQTFDNNGTTGLTDFVGVGGPSVFADVAGNELTLSIDETGNGVIDGTIVFERAISSAMQGTWRPTAAQNDPNDFLSLSFYADGTYTHMEIDSADFVEISGMEWGTYIRDPGTGLLTVTQIFDRNGDTGLTDFASGVAVAFADTVGDELTLSIDEDLDTLIDATIAFDRSDFAGGTGTGSALSCSYNSPWDDLLGQPAVFNSYTDFEAVVAACGGANPTVAVDMVGTWTDTWTDTGVVYVETVVFDVAGTAEISETADGVLVEPAFTVNWSVANDLVTLEWPDTFIDVWAFTPSRQAVYTEELSWGSDLTTLDGTAEGEIWTGIYIKQ